VVFLKFVEEVQAIAAAEVELKSPVSPFSKGDSFPWATNPSMEKGKGDFWTEYSGSYAANFWVRIIELRLLLKIGSTKKYPKFRPSTDTRHASLALALR
jgi:hypothetical protein